MKLDRDRLVAEYGRNLADHIIAQAENGEDVEAAVPTEEPETR